jgi:hypothetical protein
MRAGARQKMVLTATTIIIMVRTTMSASRRERLPYCNDDDVGSGHCARTHVPSPPKITSNFIDGYERVYFSHEIFARYSSKFCENYTEKRFFFLNAVLPTCSCIVSRHVSILVKVAHLRKAVY